MLFNHKYPRRVTSFKALVLYCMCSALLLWLLPPPIHLQFTSSNANNRFRTTTEPALVRLSSDLVEPSNIKDFFIERVNLVTGATKYFPLDPENKLLHGMRQYLQSRDGSLFLGMHTLDNETLSSWNGQTGELRFVLDRRALGSIYFAITSNGSRFAAYSDKSQVIDIYDSMTGKIIGSLEGKEKSKSRQLINLQYSLDDKYLYCSSGYIESDQSITATEVFDVTSMTSLNHFTTTKHTKDSIAPAPHGFWLCQWDFKEELILSYLDAVTGKRTILDSKLSHRLEGFPHIFSDPAGCLYLIQNCKSDANSWQHRARQTILDWLSKLGIDWHTDFDDHIQVRQISPDGHRLVKEQTFPATFAEISPDGKYLTLMSQIVNDSRNTIYRYPITLNWKHSLLWPVIPVVVYLLLKRRVFLARTALHS